MWQVSASICTTCHNDLTKRIKRFKLWTLEGHIYFQGTYTACFHSAIAHTNPAAPCLSPQAVRQDKRLELESDFTPDNNTDLPGLRFHFVVDCLTRHVNWLDTWRNTSILQEMNAPTAEIWKLGSDSSGKLHETSLNRSNDRSLHDISNYIFSCVSSFDADHLFFLSFRDRTWAWFHLGLTLPNSWSSLTSEKVISHALAGASWYNLRCRRYGIGSIETAGVIVVHSSRVGIIWWKLLLCNKVRDKSDSNVLSFFLPLGRFYVWASFIVVATLGCFVIPCCFCLFVGKAKKSVGLLIIYFAKRSRYQKVW